MRAIDVLRQTLQGLEADLQAWEPGDRDGLVEIGAGIEQVLSDVPAEMTEVIELLNLGLEGLRALYQGNVGDPRRAAADVAKTTAAARRLLAEQQEGEASADERQTAAADDSEQGETEGGPRAGAAGMSLDDVAALWVQLEPSDLTGLGRVREALNEIAARETEPDAARRIVAEAAQRTGEILEGRASDPAGVLAEVARLIEAAGEARERPASVEAPATARQPAAEAAEAEVLPADADVDLLGEFINESREYMEAAEEALLRLEAEPEDTEAVNTVFRAFHTIKGTSAFLGLSRISDLAHRAESLLSRVRDGEIRCTGGYADLALRSVDLLKELIQAVQDALGGEPMAAPDGLGELMELLADPEAAGISSEADEETAVPRLGDILVAEGKAQREEVELAAADQGEQPIGQAIVRSGAAPLTDVAAALRTQRRMSGGQRTAESSVRVRTDRLDRLIEMVGELVIAHAMTAQDETVVRGDHRELSKKVSHTGKIVRELQDLSMAMRMVPLRGTFQKMARIVRDLAHKSGKVIVFRTEGEDTEIDRNMVDVINDPLVHMVRNAVDHGIEPPEERERQGKPRAGTVQLSAYHSSGSIVVELGDDGRGLDRERIVAKAISRGLIESDKGRSDNEVFNLIFEPGFSTTDEVTEVSGRGVGLDVVKRGVEALRGRIEVSSEVGQGCTFSVRLPLTLAVTDGILVRVGDERYIVPTLNIVTTFRPEDSALSTVTGRAELVMFRGEPVALVRLGRLFEVPGAIEDPTEGLVVVLDEGDQRFALLVDELLGQQQVVAKSLGAGLGVVPGVSGGAILGDGRVGLIIDPPGIHALARQAGASGVRREGCRSRAVA